RRRHTRFSRDWSSDVCSSDLVSGGSAVPASVTATSQGGGFQVKKGLSVWDAVAILVGVVVGIGIFGFPPLVAMNAPSAGAYMGRSEERRVGKEGKWRGSVEEV